MPLPHAFIAIEKTSRDARPIASSVREIMRTLCERIKRLSLRN